MNILIVDDSAMMRSLLTDFFTTHGETVVGEAANGQRAVDLTEQLDPDFILMDIDMPVMNGIEAAEIILRRRKRPLVILSHDISGGKAERLFALGAAEVWEKPSFDKFEDPQFTGNLIQKMRLIVQGYQKRVGAPKLSQSSSPKPTAPSAASQGAVPPRKPFSLVVIGASTGGPEAVRRVLSGLPADFPLPLVLVQHIEPRFAPGYAEWLNQYTPLPVQMAENQERPLPGRVYTAPGDQHLTLCGGRLCWEDSPPVKNQKPAVERLFLSAAKERGSRVLGVMLTGMGSDGADGARAIVKAGGTMLVQNEESSFIFGMPKAAIENGGASEILPLDQIPQRLKEAVRDH